MVILLRSTFIVVAALTLAAWTHGVGGGSSSANAIDLSVSNAILVDTGSELLYQ
jgi:hypothetical protein